MKINLRYREHLEEFSAPEEAFLVGISTQLWERIQIVDGIDAYFDSISCCKTEKVFPDNNKITFLYYTSSDPAITDIINKYNGLCVLAVTFEDLEITATL